MQKAALIYNPASGRRQQSQRAKVEEAAAALRHAGIAATLIATLTPRSGGAQAEEAIAAGHDAVFACGGDGTIHDVLQGMIAAGGSVPLGIVPLGTGNVLAQELGLSFHPAAAVQQQLKFEPRRIAAGKITFLARGIQGRAGKSHAQEGGAKEVGAQGAQEDSRYFSVVAGIGVDADMLYRVTSRHKARFGMLAYFAQLRRLFGYHFEPFRAEFTDPATGRARVETATQVVAVRVSRLGMIRRTAPSGFLDSGELQFILFKTASPLRYAQVFQRAALGMSWELPEVEFVRAASLRCTPLASGTGEGAIISQADGEALGGMPVVIAVVPGAYTLMMPRR